MRLDDQVCAFIGIGGNVGDVLGAMQRGVDAINRAEACRVVVASHIYRTPPWGDVDQPDFLNACLGVETTLNAHVFYDVLKVIESDGGRVRAKRWGPRTIDLDVLTFGDQIIDDETLTVPHPRMTQRAFVLVPLADIAPDLMLAGLTIRQRVDTMTITGIEQIDAALVV